MASEPTLEQTCRRTPLMAAALIRELRQDLADAEALLRRVLDIGLPRRLATDINAHLAARGSDGHKDCGYAELHKMRCDCGYLQALAARGK